MYEGEIDGLTHEDRLTALDRCSQVRMLASESKVANLDSLEYLLRFAYAGESDIGCVSGAFKTLGVAPELARSIAIAIIESVQAGHDQEFALDAVLKRTGIRCERIRFFPASQAPVTPEEKVARDAADAEFLAKQRAQRVVEERAARALLELEREVAAILEVEIEESDDDGAGWRRVDNGIPFRPASGGAEAFDLISALKMNIVHFRKASVGGSTDASVSHTDDRKGTFTLHISDFSYSLPRTLCEVAALARRSV